MVCFAGSCLCVCALVLFVCVVGCGVAVVLLRAVGVGFVFCFCLGGVVVVCLSGRWWGCLCEISFALCGIY